VNLPSPSQAHTVSVDANVRDRRDTLHAEFLPFVDASSLLEPLDAQCYEHNEAIPEVKLKEVENLQLQITKGRSIAADGPCYAKLKYKGQKYKTLDAEMSELVQGKSTAASRGSQIDGVMAAATEAGIDMNDTQALIAFTKKHRESVAMTESKESMDVPSPSQAHIHGCRWDASFIVPLWSADDAGGLCIELYERRQVSGSTLVGRGYLKDAVAKDGELWLQLRGDDESYQGELLVWHGTGGGHSHSGSQIDGVMAAATEAGIDMNDTQAMIAFTKNYMESFATS